MASPWALRARGYLWLQNEHGVAMGLRAMRTGLMLSLGGDAVVITMNQGQRAIASEPHAGREVENTMRCRC